MSCVTATRNRTTRAVMTKMVMATMKAEMMMTATASR